MIWVTRVPLFYTSGREKAIVTFCQRLRGFKAFRNPSPTNSRASAVPTMHRPGGIQAQGRHDTQRDADEDGKRHPRPRKIRDGTTRCAIMVTTGCPVR